MLHEFLTANRKTLIARCRAKVHKRAAPRGRDAEQLHGIPLFLEQLVRTLQMEQTSTPLASRKISGPSEPGKIPVYSEIGTTASKHGMELLRRGFSVDQVVHDYGDLCQAITELAVEHDVQVKTEEFRTLNRCLDNAIADAVTEYSCQRESQISTDGAHAMGTRLGYLAHELRTLVDCATVAVAAIKSGEVGMAGATGTLLDRSLTGLRSVIDRSLADLRLAVGMPAQHEAIGLADFMAEVQVAGHLQANARGCAFTIAPVDRQLIVHADRQMLASAVSNLLHNAFKFTRLNSHISVRVYATESRLLIEIEDECGGLPQEMAEKLSRSFDERGDDRGGPGGLSVARRSVEANGGAIHVRNVPETGCVFTIDLPLRSEALAAAM